MAKSKTRYAVRVRCKEALATSGGVLTKAGTWAWLVIEADGWVPATSRFTADLRQRPPDDLVTWDTVEEAVAFARAWEGHPWYCRPDGEFVAIAVRPNMVEVQQGWALE